MQGLSTPGVHEAMILRTRHANSRVLAGRMVDDDRVLRYERKTPSGFAKSSAFSFSAVTRKT